LKAGEHGQVPAQIEVGDFPNRAIVERSKPAQQHLQFLDMCVSERERDQTKQRTTYCARIFRRDRSLSFHSLDHLERKDNERNSGTLRDRGVP
jgi:hypothetical protein